MNKEIVLSLINVSFLIVCWYAEIHRTKIVRIHKNSKLIIRELKEIKSIDVRKIMNPNPWEHKIRLERNSWRDVTGGKTNISFKIIRMK